MHALRHSSNSVYLTKHSNSCTIVLYMHVENCTHTHIQNHNNKKIDTFVSISAYSREMILQKNDLITYRFSNHILAKCI